MIYKKIYEFERTEGSKEMLERVAHILRANDKISGELKIEYDSYERGDEVPVELSTELTVKKIEKAKGNLAEMIEKLEKEFIADVHLFYKDSEGATHLSWDSTTRGYMGKVVSKKEIEGETLLLHLGRDLISPYRVVAEETL